MIRKKRWFATVYMFVMTGFFSSIVIGLTQFTRDRVQANEALSFEKAVVSVLPSLAEGQVGDQQMHELFTDKVSEPQSDSAGAYTLKQDGRIIAYALPFEGKGFWATIKGVIGIAADRKTVTGIRFYQQNETPGLGARIVETDFTDQFNGKKLASGDKAIRLLSPGVQLGSSDVHAVTGATQTSTRLEKIINDAVARWRAKLGSKE